MESTRLERAVRTLVPFAALLVTTTWLLATTTYDLGRLLRLAVEDRSLQLAALHCRVLGLVPCPATVQVSAAASIEPIPADHPAPLPPAPAARPLPPVTTTPAPRPALAPALAGLSVTQLRRLARSRGHRGAQVRDARRSDLLLMLA